MKKFIFLCTTLLCVIATKAQTASVEKIWLEHGVTQNGISGMKVHLKFNVQGMKGGSGRVIAYFDSPQGTGVKDTNGKYRTSDGNVCANSEFSPNYENAIYNDFPIFMPIDEIHLKPGKHTYYCRAFIQNLQSGSFLANSEFVSFDGTGTNNQPANNANAVAKKFPDKQKMYFSNNQQTQLVSASFYYDNQNEPVCLISTAGAAQLYWWGSNSSNGLEFYGFEYKPETKVQNSPYGGMPMITYTGNVVKVKNSLSFSLFPDYSRLTLNGSTYNSRLSYDQYQKLWDQLYGNSGGNAPMLNNGGSSSGMGGGSTSTQQGDNRCHYCRGTGNCSSCNGKGYKFNSYSGHNDTCPSCNGNGRCFNCHGSGRQR